MPSVEPGYPGGLEVGRDVTVAGFIDNDGTRIHLSRGGGEPSVVYRNTNDGSVDGLSRDETIWLLGHSEHGDSRYPALRAHRSRRRIRGRRTGRRSRPRVDAHWRSLRYAGDQRVLVGHERQGRDQLLLWDVATGAVTRTRDRPARRRFRRLLPRRAGRCWSLHTSAGRTTMHRYDLATGELVDLPAAPGVVSGALPGRMGRSGTAGRAQPTRLNSACWGRTG